MYDKPSTSVSTLTHIQPHPFLLDSKTSFKPHASIVRWRNFLSLTTVFLLASVQKSLWVWIALAKCFVTELQAYSCSACCLWFLVACLCLWVMQSTINPAFFWVVFVFISGCKTCPLYIFSLTVNNTFLLHFNTVSEALPKGWETWLWDICSHLAGDVWLQRYTLWFNDEACAPFVFLLCHTLRVTECI